MTYEDNIIISSDESGVYERKNDPSEEHGHCNILPKKKHLR